MAQQLIEVPVQQGIVGDTSPYSSDAGYGQVDRMFNSLMVRHRSVGGILKSLGDLVLVGLPMSLRIGRCLGMMKVQIIGFMPLAVMP